MRFRDKVAVITGSGAGIGKATAIGLAREGARVVLTARRKELLNETAKTIQESGGQCLVIPADLTQEEQVHTMVQRTLEAFDHVDILIANAGTGGVIKRAVDMSVAEFMEPVLINNLGTFLCCREVLKQSMLPRSAGVIVTLSSLQGKHGTDRRAHYSTSRWGVIGFTQSLAWEVGQSGIRVNCVCPGAVPTEKVLASWQNRWRVTGQTYEQVLKSLNERAALGRVPTVQEAVNIILFLCSDESSGMTGQAINITCGAEMR